MKIFLLIALLFSKTYGAMIDKLEEHFTYIHKFKQIISDSTGQPQEPDPKSIPFEKQTVITIREMLSKLTKIHIDRHLDALHIIGNNNNQFHTITERADICLTNIPIALVQKPGTENDIRQWKTNWVTTMESLTDLQKAIAEQLAPYKPDYKMFGMY